MSQTNTDPVRPTPEAMSQALRTLRDGGVVAFPTETVYGLGAAISNERAVSTIFDLKHRPRSRPLLAHVSSVEMARDYVADWPERAEELAKRFWPGPLTLVLPKRANVPGVVVADGSTVGLRCPDHPVAIELIESLGEPIAGTSANHTGQAPAVLPEHVRDAFEPDCVYLLDAGRSPGGLESTVLLLGETQEADRILRPGPIGAAELGVELESSTRLCLTDRSDVPGDTTSDGGTGVSPVIGDSVTGETPVPLIRQTESRDEASAETVGSEKKVRLVASRNLQLVLEELQPAAIITHHPEQIEATCRAKLFVLPSDAKGYSRLMYAVICEAAGQVGEKGSVVVVKPDESGELWQAIVHRLERFDSEI